MDAYNAASLAVRRIVALWRSDTGRADATLAAAAASSPDAPDRLRAIANESDALAGSAGALRDRLEQFLAESTEIVPAAFDALAHGGLARFGALVDESQRLAEEKLRNQVPETIALQRIARIRCCGGVGVRGWIRRERVGDGAAGGGAGVRRYVGSAVPGSVSAACGSVGVLPIGGGAGCELVVARNRYAA